MFKGHLDQMLEGIQYEVVAENADDGWIDLSIDLQKNQGNETLINRVVHQFQTSQAHGVLCACFLTQTKVYIHEASAR